MKVLIACEFSGIVRDAFTAKGHEAWSCDLLESDRPGNHFQCDVANILPGSWDIIIAHPPCTWLCQAMRTNAARKDRPTVTPVFLQERQKAFEFAIQFFEFSDRVCVENPIGYLNSNYRKPDQLIRPFMFGHPYKKDICLWLKGLPKLEPTGFVDPPYKKLDFWSSKRNPGGRSLKSITFRGIAEAMANQWG